MNTITTRPQFVAHRNVMYAKLAEMDRQAPHMARVEARSGATDRCTGEQHGAGAHKAETDRLAADYKLVCEISAMKTPTQSDFDKAAEIFEVWNIVAYSEVCPPKPVGRPQEMANGRARTVYLDDESFAVAKTLGNGSASEGIRAALKIAAARDV